MLAVIQYSFYFLVGAFYYLVVAAYMGVAAGFGFLALVLLLLPLLSGFVSGLSFFFPRIAAASAGMSVLPFLYVGISAIFTDSAGVEPSLFVIPSAVVILVSVFALLLSKASFVVAARTINGQSYCWNFRGFSGFACDVDVGINNNMAEWFPLRYIAI